MVSSSGSAMPPRSSRQTASNGDGQWFGLDHGHGSRLVHADAQQARMLAFGTLRATAEQAGEGAILVPRGRILEHALRLGSGALWHVRRAGVAGALWRASLALQSLHLNVNFVALAWWLLVVASGWWRWWRR